jgi:tRNA uridine 5-carbamoylmethylation protein Kti12
VIIIFCGIPGCGKTTVAELLAERLPVHGPIQLLTSDKLRPPVYKKLFRALATNEKRADFVILDATFYKREWRQQVKALAVSEKVITVYLECPLSTALERNRTRRANISEKAIRIIFHKFEPPMNPTIKIDTTVTAAVRAADQIFEFIKDQL